MPPSMTRSYFRKPLASWRLTMHLQHWAQEHQLFWARWSQARGAVQGAWGSLTARSQVPARVYSQWERGGPGGSDSA